MKRKRAARALQLMRDAQQEIGTDHSLQEAGELIQKAIVSLSKVERQRSVAAEQHKMYLEIAKKNHEKWSATLLDGLKKLAEQSATSQTLLRENQTDDSTGTSSEPR